MSKAYHEYLELHGYFARSDDARLSRAEFDALDVEFRALASRHKELSTEERARLIDLKAVLHRDRP